MRLRTFLTCFSLLPLSACTRSCNDYDNNEEFARAQLPAYSETGANTLGCRLGTQTWTVLGSYALKGGLGTSWRPNVLQIDGGTLVAPLLYVRGQMTGVRNGQEFYDTEITLAFRPSDTLGGLRLLGADTARVPTGRAEHMKAFDLLPFRSYESRNRRPVRLLIRKLDRQQRIVSGTFEGQLYSQTDSLAVSDGRFDVKY